MENKWKFTTLRGLFQKYPIWQDWWYVFIWDKVYDRNQMRGAWVASSPDATWTDVVWFSSTITFSSTAYNIVAWTIWTISLWNWDTYTIPSWNTWVMTQITYIYLDTNTSTLLTTTDASNSVWQGKILVCVAKPTVSWKSAQFQAFGTNSQSVFITADNIRANVITANEIASNTITTDEINFWFASSSIKWWAINSWFTSSNLNSVSAPSTWVKIDSNWIKMYSSWVEKVSIWADWNATFQGTITASTINWWEINWSAIVWWSLTTYEDVNWSYIVIDWNRIYLAVAWGPWWAIRVQSISSTWTDWIQINWRTTIDRTWDSCVIKWKLQIPVWTNLY